MPALSTTTAEALHIARTPTTRPRLYISPALSTTTTEALHIASIVNHHDRGSTCCQQATHYGRGPTYINNTCQSTINQYLPINHKPPNSRTYQSMHPCKRSPSSTTPPPFSLTSATPHRCLPWGHGGQAAAGQLRKLQFLSVDFSLPDLLLKTLLSRDMSQISTVQHSCPRPIPTNPGPPST